MSMYMKNVTIAPGLPYYVGLTTEDSQEGSLIWGDANCRHETLKFSMFRLWYL